MADSNQCRSGHRYHESILNERDSGHRGIEDRSQTIATNLSLLEHALNNSGTADRHRDQRREVDRCRLESGDVSCP